MKRFKEFKSEQQYITEVGPVGAAIMGAMGLWGAWKSYKKVKDGIKGFRESGQEKKDNFKNGFNIRVKKFNPETGKIEPDTVEIPPNDKRAKINDEGIVKLEKEEQAKQDKLNKEAEAKWKAEKKETGLDDKGLAAKKAKVTSDQKRIDDGDEKIPADKIKLKYKVFDRKPEDGGAPILTTVTLDKAPNDMFADEINDFQDDKTAKAEKQFADYKKALPDEDVRDDTEDTPAEPEGTPPETTDDDETKDDETKDGDDEEEKEDDPEEILRSKGDKPPDDGGIDDDGEANAYLKLVGKAPTGWAQQKSKTGKSTHLVKKSDIPKKKIGTGTAGKRTGVAAHTPPKQLKKAGVESTMLKFGEFITEDVMKDLKLATKSRKDSEITLDDGTDIPMDAFTAEILVKYIEGLNSSEQKKIIKQIQRTERAFMKVLGKAHEG